jgi:hypothetical protein
MARELLPACAPGGWAVPTPRRNSRQCWGLSRHVAGPQASAPDVSAAPSPSPRLLLALQEAVQYSEESRTKCIGLTIETRPDYCLKPHLTDMLSYGCTRLEMGVQSIFEDVARDTNRGHTVQVGCGWCRRAVWRLRCGCAATSPQPRARGVPPADGVLACPTLPASRTHTLPPCHSRFCPTPTPGREGVLCGRQGCRLQGGVPHDAGPAQRGLGARPGVLQGVLREPRVQVGAAPCR